jgi:hypothetical protein
MFAPEGHPGVEEPSGVELARGREPRRRDRGHGIEHPLREHPRQHLAVDGVGDLQSPFGAPTHQPEVDHEPAVIVRDAIEQRPGHHRSDHAPHAVFLEALREAVEVGVLAADEDLLRVVDVLRGDRVRDV